MDSLRPLLDAFVAHAYLVVFVGALIDATGLPFPGRLLLAAAGASAAAGNGSVTVFIVLGALGAMVSDQLWFWTATRGSVWLVDAYRRLTRRAPSGGDGAVESLVRHGPLSVILGRFFTVVRLVAWPVLVRNGLGWPRFVALDALGALIWSTTWVGLGWIVGDQWQDAAQSVTGWLMAAGVVVVVVLAGPLALRVWRRRAREGGAHRVRRPPGDLSVPRETPADASRESPRVPRARPRP
jgi:membrane protein DedA with SNARE-associated domain